MTLEECKQALREGKQLTHSYFTPDEYITQQGSQIVTDEFCKLN